MDKIKPCPFCKSANVELHRNFDYVYCKDCGAKGSHFDGHPIDAINVWNGIVRIIIQEKPSIIQYNIGGGIKKINLDATRGMTRG